MDAETQKRSDAAWEGRVRLLAVTGLTELVDQVESMPSPEHAMAAWASQPQHLIHDRDNVYGNDFGTKLAAIGIADVRTPYRAPLANSVAERVVRTFRQECLDHVIVLIERHLATVVAEFVHYYNHDRPHRTVEQETPVPGPPISGGGVVSRPILGGLHHAYARAA